MHSANSLFILPNTLDDKVAKWGNVLYNIIIYKAEEKIFPK